MMRLLKLKILKVAMAKINSEGAYWLARGVHPLLKSLALSHNELDAKGVQHLASGCWLLLQSLLLAGNLLGRRGWRLLTKGHWLLLEHLHTGLSMFKSHVSVGILRLDPQTVRECMLGAHNDIVRLHRSVPHSGVGLWPNLHQVMVSSPPRFSQAASLMFKSQTVKALSGSVICKVQLTGDSQDGSRQVGQRSPPLFSP